MSYLDALFTIDGCCAASSGEFVKCGGESVSKQSKYSLRTVLSSELTVRIRRFSLRVREKVEKMNWQGIERMHLRGGVGCMTIIALMF